MDQRSELTRKFAAAGHGYPRDAVINAGGNMVINAIRQSHGGIAGAEAELADLYERMRAALRERHYMPDGSRREHHIIVPGPDVLFPAGAGAD